MQAPRLGSGPMSGGLGPPFDPAQQVPGGDGLAPRASQLPELADLARGDPRLG